MDKEQREAIKQRAVRGKPYAERISIVLAFRLLGLTDKSLDIFSVLEELDYLEEIVAHSKTKAEAQFRRPPLYPFWHKHFFSSKHLAANLVTRWNMGSGGNKDLRELVTYIEKNHGHDVEAWPNLLAQKLVIKGFEDRCKRGLTGDWMIYAKYENQNYYLDLATHNEGTAEEASALYARLENGCHAEFPFLFEQKQT